LIQVTETQQQVLEQLLVELAHGDRSLWDDLTPPARQEFLKIMDEIRDSGGSGLLPGDSHSLDDLWELDYLERPPDIDTFIDDPYYLGDALYGGEDWYGTPIEGGQIWPNWRPILREIYNGQYYQIVFTGAIGTGKSSAAQIILAYDLCRLLCLRNPQQYYGSIRARPMVIGLFNITKILAENVNYAPFRRTIMMSPFFKKYLVEERWRSEKWIHIAGDKLRIALGSDAIHALGEDIVAGMLDEANFRGPSKPVNQVAKTYQTVARRMESRFMEAGRVLPGHLILLSSKSYATSFLEKHIEEVKNQPGCFISSAALYDMKPWTKWSGEVFRVVIGDKYHDSRMVETDEWVDEEAFDVEYVPIEFQPEFERDLEAAVQDICGKSTHLIGALFSNTRAIKIMADRPDRPGHPFGKQVIESNANDPTDPTFESYLDPNKLIKVRKTPSGPKPEPLFYSKAGRYIHVDLSKNQMSTGIVMGCRGEPKVITRIDHDGKEFDIKLPTVWIDFFLQIKPALGGKINYGNLDAFLVFLRKIGFRIKQISFDQYQSEHSQQFLSKLRFDVIQKSVDRDDKAYVALREAMYDGRVVGYDYPPLTDLRDGELANLVHDIDARKVRKDDEGSKDIADCLAAVVHECVGGETIDTEGTLSEEAVDYLGMLSASHGRMLDEERPDPNQRASVPGVEGDHSWILGDYKP